MVWVREKGRVCGVVGRESGSDGDEDVNVVVNEQGLKSAQRYFVSVRLRGWISWVTDSTLR